MFCKWLTCTGAVSSNPSGKSVQLVSNCCDSDATKRFVFIFSYEPIKHALYVYDSMQRNSDRRKKKIRRCSRVPQFVTQWFYFPCIVVIWKYVTKWHYFCCKQWADNICNHVQLVFTMPKQTQKNMWKMCMPFGLLRHMIMTIWNHTTLNWI